MYTKLGTTKLGTTIHELIPPNFSNSIGHECYLSMNIDYRVILTASIFRMKKKPSENLETP